MSEPRQITVQQRMSNFASLTRQHKLMLPKQTVTAENSTVQFILPKAQLLAQIFLLVDVKVTSGTMKTNESPLDRFNILRRINLELNNGFSPVVMSGKELALLNCVANNPQKILEKNYLINGGYADYNFILEIKNTLNDSMLQGLYVLQNSETTVSLNIDVGQVTDALQSGTFKSVTIEPMIVTYSIPPVEAAHPDISLIKIMQAKTTSFLSGGKNILYLDTGTIYRKLIFSIVDSEGNPIKADKMTGNFELALNTADIPYNISPRMLQAINTDQLGHKLPDGCYVFDFSSQSPLIGYGGSRDYIDTEKLTHFTLSINTPSGCKVTTIVEQLSRLK